MFWIYGYAADMFGMFQADVCPALTAVIRPVDAVAIRNGSLAIVLACSHPNDCGIPGIEYYRADRVGALAVKDRTPGRTCIGRFPHAARSGGREVVTPVRRVDCKRDYPS